MGPSLVAEADPVADHAAGVLQTLEAVAMYTLLFESADHTFDHPVLLGVVRADELLPPPNDVPFWYSKAPTSR